MPIRIEAQGQDVLIVRYRNPDTLYSQAVNEATSMPSAAGPFEEVQVIPGHPFELSDDATIISVKHAGTGVEIPRSNWSPNGGGSGSD